LFASAIHDVDHPGVTNQYLVNTGMASASLTVIYTDFVWSSCAYLSMDVM